MPGKVILAGKIRSQLTQHLKYLLSVQRPCSLTKVQFELFMIISLPIGIAGRTRAGKSTLSISLFRTVERSGGKIIINGIDIPTFKLHNICGKLIPQVNSVSPVVFFNSLQTNNFLLFVLFFLLFLNVFFPNI